MSARIIKKMVLVWVLAILLMPNFVLAEAKPDNAPGTIIPKLSSEETKDAPVLNNGNVYPFWGPVCQRYTYSVVYQDTKNRAPQYVKIYFNGEMKDMQKENPNDHDYQKGVKYIFQNVPNKIGSNFYYFEASNGQGKARDSIIDSPDNGPVLFPSDFTHNEIVFIDKDKNEILWRYPTDKEWVGGVALSDNGKYLAVQTSFHIYLFDTAKPEPLWTYEAKTDIAIGGDVKGGIDISADGEKIFAAIAGKSILFSKNSQQPIWEYSGKGQVSGNAYNVAISADGNFAASAMAGGGECEEQQAQCQAKDVLIFWNTKSQDPLWKYPTDGNFHDVSLSHDGSYLASATGCPDRRAYIFSKDSNQPLVRSEMLTKDSPVDTAKISADGSLAAFGSESSDGAVFLFNKDSKKPLWKFSTPNGSSVRALDFTPDGEYIGAATMLGGNAYIFSQDTNQPIASWQLNTSLGALAMADDGSYLAVGATDKKVHILARDQKEQQQEFALNEFVGEMDISGNGKYLAAGTSGSVYFFDTLQIPEQDKIYDCTNVIEPSPEANKANLDSGQNQQKKQNIPWLYISLIPIIMLIIYLIIIKIKKISASRIVIVILLILIVGCLGLFIYHNFIQDRLAIPQDNQKNQDQETGENNSSDTEDAKQLQGECGNGICEPDLGESKESCSKDCSGSDTNQNKVD